MALLDFLSSNKKTKKSAKNSAVKPLTRQERLAKKRKFREAQKKVLSLLGFSIFFAVIVGIPAGLIGGPKVGLLVGIGIPIAVLCFSYPRPALWFFLMYMPFSGTVTYWIGAGNALFQLSKDAFYIPALLGLLWECRQKRQPILIPKQLVPTLGILFFAALMTLLLVNGLQETLPACDELTGDQKFLLDAAGNYVLDSRGIVISVPCKDGSPFLQGLIGLKVLMGYIPLIFCTQYLLQDKKKLLFLGRLLVVLAIICCVLGLAQYWMLKTGRCVGTREMTGLDLFQPDLSAKCLVGGSLLYSPQQGQIRLPGTFVSPWHWAWFLVGNAGISYAVAFSDTVFFWRTTALVSMGLVFINAVICGQRLALAAVPAFILILLILTGQFANLKRFIPTIVGISLLLVIGFSFLNPDFIQERIDSFVARWNTAPPYEFIQKQFNYAFSQQKGFLGNGLGKATNSARIFGSISLVETFHPKLLYETGYLGFLTFMTFITHLSVLSFKTYRSIRTPSLRSFASSFWVFILIIGYFPYWYPLDTDPVAVYFWLFAGVIFTLPKFDKQEQEALKAEKVSRLSGKKTPTRVRKRLSPA